MNTYPHTYISTYQPAVCEAVPKTAFKRTGKLEINPLLVQAFGISPEKINETINASEEPEEMREMFAFMSAYATLSDPKTRMSISGVKLDFLVADMRRRMSWVADFYEEHAETSGDIEEEEELLKVAKKAEQLSKPFVNTRPDKIAYIDAIMNFEHTSGHILPVAFGISDYGREDYWPRKLLAFLRTYGMPGVSTSGTVRESTAPCWEKYLYQEKANPKKLDLSGSFTRERYTGIVNPNVEILDIVTVLARADINYTPEEYPAEQPYIDNRLIPHMRTTKLPFPVIEIYTRDAVDNQRPYLLSGKRPFTDIHIIDGAHRIVALKKMGINEIPFIVYREPLGGKLMVKEGTTPAPEPANKEFRANPNLINRELAMRSHSGTSFSPEKRGEQEIEGFVAYVQEVYDRLSKHAKTDRQKEYLLTEMARFQSTFAGKYNAKLSAQGSCMSTMIAGPSKFPTGRAQKACSAADKRYEELIEFRDRAEAAILRELKKMGVEEAGGEVAVLRNKIADAEKLQEMMVEANKIIRKKAEPGIGGVSKQKQLVNLGFTEQQAAEALKPDFAGRLGFPSYALQNNSANIRRMKERIAELEKKETTPSGDIVFAGGTIHDSKEDDRIQIFFDQKPPQDMINRLKSEGWRWAPSIGAWSRKRTDMALFSARRILGLEAQKPVFVPAKEEPKIDEEVHARIQKVIDIMIIYRDRGATYEDFLAGLKGYYLAQSGYVMGSNLNVQKLIDDVKKSGHNNLRELWRKIIVQAPETPTALPPKRIPMLYPAAQPPTAVLPAPAPAVVTTIPVEQAPREYTWRKFPDHKSETKAVKDALEKAGIKAEVGHGTGTAWGWLEINIGDPRLRGGLKAPPYQYQYTAEEMALQDRVLKIAQEVTGRRGEYQGNISILAQEWRHKPPVAQAPQPQAVTPTRPAEEIMFVPNPETLTKEEYVTEKYKRMAQVLRQQGKNAIADRVEKGARDPSMTFKYETSHRDQVVLALAQGKPVSPVVLQDYPDIIARVRQENEAILAKEKAERERIKAIERAEENELNAELNKLPPALKRHAETEIYGTLHLPETHKDYRNRFYIALGKVRSIAFAHLPGRETVEFEREKKPIQSRQDMKQQALDSIQAARTEDELHSLLKTIAPLPLTEVDKRQILDAFVQKVAMLRGAPKAKPKESVQTTLMVEERMRRCGYA